VIDGWKGSDDDLSVVSDIGSIESEARAVISRAGYQLLLDELIIDRECERMLFRARPHPDGVELSGPEDDFDVLTDAVAFEANPASKSIKGTPVERNLWPSRTPNRGLDRIPR
jgi:hypothetical protein